MTKAKKALTTGAPSGAPVYYFVRQFHKGSWKYFDKNGNEVSEEKVKRSKRKVYTENKDKQKINRKGSVKKLRPIKKEDTVLKTSIFAYDVIKKITDNVAKGRRNFFVVFGNSYEVSRASTPIFTLAFTEIHGEFLSLFHGIFASPILLIGYIEFRKDSIFDFDSVTFDIGGGEYEGLGEDDFKTEDGEEMLEEGPEVRTAMRNFRRFIKRKFKEYFNL